MPRKGFKSVTLPEDLYRELQERAKLYGTTLQGIIKIALSDENPLLKGPSKSMVEGSNPSGPAIEPSFLEEKKLHQEKSFFNNRETCTVQCRTSCTVQLGDFKEFLKVDQHLSPSTVRNYAMHVSKALRFCGPEPEVRQLRSYLATLKNPFTENLLLTKAAMLHSQDMAAHGFLSHIGSDGSTLQDRLLRVGYTNWYVAENAIQIENPPYKIGVILFLIPVPFPSQKSDTSLAEEMVKAWMDSPGHRANILNPQLTEIGVGAAANGSTIYATTDFGGVGRYW